MISELVQALIGVGSLLKQGSPSVIGVKPWCGGMLLAINGDGNCTGTSWMVCSLVWAAQAPRRLKSRSTIGGGWGYDDSVPGVVTKQPLPDVGQHDHLHGRQAFPEFNSFYQGLGQIYPW